MKRKLIEFYGLTAALTILSVFSAGVLVVSGGTALVPLLGFWLAGRIDANIK